MFNNFPRSSSFRPLRARPSSKHAVYTEGFSRFSSPFHALPALLYTVCLRADGRKRPEKQNVPSRDGARGALNRNWDPSFHSLTISPVEHVLYSEAPVTDLRTLPPSPFGLISKRLPFSSQAGSQSSASRTAFNLPISALRRGSSNRVPPPPSPHFGVAWRSVANWRREQLCLSAKPAIVRLSPGLVCEMDI